MVASGKLQIFVTEYPSGDRYEITDNLYWFEENFVQDLNGAMYDRFGFEIIVDGVTVWKNTAE